MSAVSGPVGDVASKLTSRIFSGIFYFGIALVAIGIVSGLMYYFVVYKRRFNIKVKIISQRAKDKNYIYFDKAAILKDRKTKSKYFRIWGLKVDLPIPNFQVLQFAGGKDYLELYRESEDEFYFLLPPKIDKTTIVKPDGKIYLVGSQSHKRLDTDLSYWNVKRKRANKSMFNTEGLMFKLLPYIPIIMGGMIMIFMLYILLDHLPAILSSLRELVSEMKTYKSAGIITGIICMKLKSKY